MFVTEVYITGARTADRNHTLVHIPAAGCCDLASGTYSYDRITATSTCT